MKFFLEYLSHFSAADILRMYGEGAFRTSEEIKLADFVINFKVVFHDNHITSDDLNIYLHLQRIVDAVRAHQIQNGSTVSANAEELFRLYSLEEVHFNNFVKYSESEKEVRRVNVLERRICFAFKDVQANVNTLIWLRNALEELLNYVLRNFEDEDRVGIVINYESQQNHNAAFPIKLKNQLKASILVDTLNSILRTRGTIVTGQRMALQLVRIRIPASYRKLTTADVTKISGSESPLLL